jgi:hypothetical protein
LETVATSSLISLYSGVQRLVPLLRRKELKINGKYFPKSCDSVFRKWRFGEWGREMIESAAVAGRRLQSPAKGLSNSGAAPISLMWLRTSLQTERFKHGF